MQNKKIVWKIIELIFLFEAVNKSKLNIDSIKSDLFALNSLLKRWGEVTHKDSADILHKISELTTSNQQYELIENERMFYEDYLENTSKYKDIIFILRLFLKKNLYFISDDASMISSSEGSSIFDQHFARERDARIIKAKKEQEISIKGYLACEACNFNFEEKYGMHGINYAEVHHLKPISEHKDACPTYLGDLCILCSNCHRMIHRKLPWLSIDDLKKIILDKDAA